MTAALEGGEWSTARPGRTLPPGKTRYPLYRRLGGPQGRSGRAENLVPTDIRSRTVQPVAQSLYRLSYPAQVIGSAPINICNILYMKQASAQPSQQREIHCVATGSIRDLCSMEQETNSQRNRLVVYVNSLIRPDWWAKFNVSG